MKLNQLVLMAILLVTSAVFGQLTGKVVDGDYPLEYATATLFSTKDKSVVAGVVTNSDGTFVIGNLKNGNYYLEVSFIGFEKKSFKDIVIDSKKRALNFGLITLLSGENQLNDVVVTTDKGTVVSKIDRQIYDTKTFQNSRGGSAIDVLRNLPSISIDGQGDISVRGTTGFMVLLNGKPTQGSISTILGQLPANAIERVEVVTAPSAKYDPDGKAGILNIITKKGATNGAYTQVNVKGGFPSIENYDNKKNAQRYGVDGTYNLKKDKWDISVGGSYGRNDIQGRREGNVFTNNIAQNYKTEFPSDGERSTNELNYSGRFTVDFMPSDADDFTVGFYGGKRKVDRQADIYYNNKRTSLDDGSVLNTFDYYNENLRVRDGDFALGSFNYSHKFFDKSKLTASFLYEYTLLGGPTTNLNLGYTNSAIVYQDEYNTNENPLYGTRAQLDYEFKPFSFGKLEAGYQFRKLKNNGNFIYERRNLATGEYELVPEFTSQVNLDRLIHSGYLQLNGSKKKWEYAAGLRLESMNRDFYLKGFDTAAENLSYDYVKLFPSASAQYTMDNNVKVKVGYSKRVDRAPTYQMNPFKEREHSETFEQGDKNLRPEFTDLIELGISKNFKGGNSLFATAYYRDVQNLINRVNTLSYTTAGVLNDTILDRIYTNVGRGRTLGLEVGAQIKPSAKWTNFIGANVYNFNIDGNFNGKAINSNAVQYSINANSTYTFTATTSVQFTLNYLSERITAQGEDSRFYSPNITVRKSFLDKQLVATLQWQNIDMGLLNSNEQRITTYNPAEYYTTTNYVYEVDMVTLNLSYTFNKTKNSSKFIDSEFGKKEF
ncbi:outer membrane beta-barrel protein [Flavobacterium algicola]|uniref:outer membrane beta-barrel protein n=1 Tax=Flavobacterium algicola TaxID=556529 RepID=UPI001EFC8B50|nr:outer membrane beta-barrel protein [Flavobacterium algicola]MCG9791580.1 TonB-dependent receptor [Flavobacterium algicola]